MFGEITQQMRSGGFWYLSAPFEPGLESVINACDKRIGLFWGFPMKNTRLAAFVALLVGSGERRACQQAIQDAPARAAGLLGRLGVSRGQ